MDKRQSGRPAGKGAPEGCSVHRQHVLENVVARPWASTWGSDRKGQMAPTHRPREEPAQTETLGHEDARHERGFQKKQKGKRLKTAKHWRVQKIINGCLKNLGEKNQCVKKANETRDND